MPMSRTANHSCSGFTLIEVLVTVTALVIILGLMVGLARQVRSRSAQGLTRELLTQLDRQLAQYMATNDGAVPPQGCLPDGVTSSEKTIQVQAEQVNRAGVRALRLSGDATFLQDLPPLMFDQVNLRDAWGTPILLMPRQDPAIGMAPRDRPFFFSAGPDRKYLTRDDNMYSYEAGGG